MKVLLIDQLSRENGYRINFWKSKKESFSKLDVEIPSAIEGKIVRKVMADGSFEKIQLDDFDLIMIHDRDDRSTGYEGTAIQLGKPVIVYSDNFDEAPTFTEQSRLLKIKGSVLYARLSDFLTKMGQHKVVDFQILVQFNETLEGLLLPFAGVNPFQSNPTLKSAKIKLQEYIDKLMMI